jgi:hypothetical protein
LTPVERVSFCMTVVSTDSSGMSGCSATGNAACGAPPYSACSRATADVKPAL